MTVNMYNNLSHKQNIVYTATCNFPTKSFSDTLLDKWFSIKRNNIISNQPITSRINPIGWQAAPITTNVEIACKIQMNRREINLDNLQLKHTRTILSKKYLI